MSSNPAENSGTFNSLVGSLIKNLAVIFNPDKARSSMSEKGRHYLQKNPDELKKAYYKYSGVKRAKNLDSKIELK